MLELFVEFLLSAWRFLPWLLLAAFVLEFVLQIIGLKSVWLLRRPKRKKHQKKPVPMSEGLSLLLGLMLGLVVLGLSFAAFQVNRWLSFGFQALLGAFLLDNRRLYDIGDRLVYMLSANKQRPASVLLSRFVGRDATRLNGHELIGLGMSTAKAAVPAASVGPIFAMMLGGVPLMVLAKFVLVNEWKRRDPLAAPSRRASVCVVCVPVNALTKAMLKLSAAIMGFVHKPTPVSGVRYMLSDLERNGRHLALAALVSVIVSIDILIIARLVIRLTGG